MKEIIWLFWRKACVLLKWVRSPADTWLCSPWPPGQRRIWACLSLEIIVMFWIFWLYHLSLWIGLEKNRHGTWASFNMPAPIHWRGLPGGVLWKQILSGYETHDKKAKKQDGAEGEDKAQTKPDKASANLGVQGGEALWLVFPIGAVWQCTATATETETGHPLSQPRTPGRVTR